MRKCVCLWIFHSWACVVTKNFSNFSFYLNQVHFHNRLATMKLQMKVVFHNDWFKTDYSRTCLTMWQILKMDIKFNMIALKAQNHVMFLSRNVPRKPSVNFRNRHSICKCVWSLKIFMVGDRLCLLFYALGDLKCISSPRYLLGTRSGE